MLNAEYNYSLQGQWKYIHAGRGDKEAFLIGSMAGDPSLIWITVGANVTATPFVITFLMISA